MRALQALSSMCRRLHNGAISGTSTEALALAVCFCNVQDTRLNREFWNTANSLRFMPTTAEPQRVGLGEQSICYDVLKKSIELFCGYGIELLLLHLLLVRSTALQNLSYLLMRRRSHNHDSIYSPLNS